MARKKKEDEFALPSTDKTDAQTMKDAASAAKAINTRFKKKVRKKLPLFEEEILADYVPATADTVIDKRVVIQAEQAVFWKEFRATKLTEIRKFRREVFELCADLKEYKRIRKNVSEMFGGDKWSKWYRMLCRMRERLKPMSETALLVLAWVEVEEGIFTHWDIWRKRGDGLTPVEILYALNEVAEREYLEIVGSAPTTTEDGRQIDALAYRFVGVNKNGSNNDR